VNYKGKILILSPHPALLPKERELAETPTAIGWGIKNIINPHFELYISRLAVRMENTIDGILEYVAFQS